MMKQAGAGCWMGGRIDRVLSPGPLVPSIV